MQPRQPQPSTGFWTPSAWFLAQVNHFIVGLLVPAFAFGAVQLNYPKLVLVPIVGIAVWALVKEFVLDLFVVEHDSFEGSSIDFFFYILGDGLWYWGLDHFVGASVIFLVVLFMLTLIDIASQHLPSSDDLS